MKTWLERLPDDAIKKVWTGMHEFGLSNDQIRSIMNQSDPITEQELDLMKEVGYSFQEMKSVLKDLLTLGLIKFTGGGGGSGPEVDGSPQRIDGPLPAESTKRAVLDEEPVDDVQEPKLILRQQINDEGRVRLPSSPFNKK